MLNKKLLIALIVLVVVLVAVAVWVGVKLKGTDASAPSAYSAVVLVNGDIYFGKLTWFPSPKLTNVWLLQRSVDEQNQIQLGVVSAKNAFWQPVDEVYLNSSQIVSWTRLRQDSQLVQAMENPESVRTPQGQSAAPGAATSTFRGPTTAPPGQ